jgi:hypothetical protein
MLYLINYSIWCVFDMNESTREIQTSYSPFYTPDPNHSATTVVAAGSRFFLFYSCYLYNTTPPNRAALRQTTNTNPTNQYTHNPASPPGQPWILTLLTTIPITPAPPQASDPCIRDRGWVGITFASQYYIHRLYYVQIGHHKSSF